jgi:exonuclease III
MLIDQLNKYKADITAIQEVRWKGNGTLEKKECIFFYSSSTNKHQFGTGFIVDKRVRHTVIDFKPVNERISRLRVRGKFFNCSIINAHAPTEEKSEEETFYEGLERAYDEAPRGDIKIVFGDMNAQIGREDIYLPTIGKRGLHQQSNDNGIRLINFAAFSTAKSVVNFWMAEK